MRDYVGHLPDYTCRVTLERSTRRNARMPFELSDRLRLEVAYTGGQELYSWPGADRFEAGIEDLLPGRGMVSNGSYALHMRNLFVRDVAAFAAPREERCDDRPCVRLDFDIPAERSGYSISSGSGAAPAALTGSAWFDQESLDILRLEVRVGDTPRNVRIAGTREITVYARGRIGDVENVLPASSELVLRDRDGSEAKNHATFDHYRRYSGSVTVFYNAGADPGQSPSPAPPGAAQSPPPREIIAMPDAAIEREAAIGDQVPMTTRDGARVTARISNMRRLRKSWVVDLTLEGMARRALPLPLAAGVSIVFRRTN
jgi:hypothetical protein